MLRTAGVFFILLLVPFAASAALLDSIQSPIEIGVSPAHPRPGDQVTLTVSDIAGDPGTTTYVWSVDGKVVDQGIGKTSISLTAGSSATSQSVNVLAVQNGAGRGSATVVIRPATVDLIWEGNTYTPPFYEGRPFPNGESAVTLFAVPHLFEGSTETPASTVVYTWKVDDVLMQKQSGYGKSNAVISPPLFGAAFTVSVEAATPDGLAVADETITIEPQTPSMLFYENAPLLGIRFDTAASGSIPFPIDEISFNAYPLFVNSADALSYVWKLDDNAFAVDPLHPRDVTFRKTGAGTGTHTITLSFDSATNFLEHGQGAFQLTF